MAVFEPSTFLSRRFSITNIASSLLITVILMCWIPSAHSCFKIVPSLKYHGKVLIASPRVLTTDTNVTMAIIAHNATVDDLLEIEIGGNNGNASPRKIPLKNDVPIFFESYLNYDDFVEEAKGKGWAFIHSNIGTNFTRVTSGIYIVDFYTSYIFLQTDKSVYYPSETVQIRVIPLNDQLLLENITIRMEIENPQNITVHKSKFLPPWEGSLSQQFPKLNFSLSTSPMLGKWKVYAFYGKNFRQNFSVNFQVRQYVWPTFRVKLRVPRVVLNSDKEIKIKVLAEYAYGKTINGTANCDLSVVDDDGEMKIGLYDKKVTDGEAIFSFTLAEILRSANINTFPRESKLSIKCFVIDAATDIKEETEKAKIDLAKSPYLIAFDQPLKYFKPGVTSVLKVKVTYIDEKPAVDVPIVLNIADSHKKPSRFFRAKSDKDGCIFYYFQLPTGTDPFIATVTTNDERYNSEQQSRAVHQFQKFLSENYIAISRNGTRTVKIGQMFTAEVVTYPSEGYHQLYFAVLVRRRMLLLKSIPKVIGESRKLHFAITAEMFPIVRVVIFAVEHGTLFVDSLGLTIESNCQIAIQTDFSRTQPGSSGKFILKGQPGAKVGLLATDISAFETKNRDTLTDEKVWEILADKDLATGPIEGINSKEILFNSGLMIFGNMDYEDTGGYDKPPWINLPQTKHFNENKKIEIHFSEKHSVPAEKEVKVRSDFRETWLFQDCQLSSDGSAVVHQTLPDSVTTWVIRAVSVTPGGGICLSQPREINSSKDIFIKLNIPFSVVRNQSVDIQAIIINNHPQEKSVTVYISVFENLSTRVKVREKTERLVIEGFSAGKVHLSFVPSKIGDYLIDVTASSAGSRDSVSKKLRVAFEGITEEDVIEIVLDPTNRRKMRPPRVVTDSVSDYINQPIQETIINLQPRRPFLTGSEKFIITTVGNEFGLDFENPRQNSQYFASTVEPVDSYQRISMYMDRAFYALNLLENRRKISSEKREKLYNYLRIGYTRVLTLRNTHGYFSKSVNHSPNIWLTSFLTKMMCRAKKYIFIDKNVIHEGLKWIITKQNPEGSFDDVDAVESDHLNRNASKFLMTSLVLINLRECSGESKELRIVLRRAESFLEKHFDSVNDSYVMATTSYALAVTNSSKKYEANNKLQRMSIFDADSRHRYWKKGSRMETIETTAYALLTQLHLKNATHDLSIVDWMKTLTFKEEVFLSNRVRRVVWHALWQYRMKYEPNEVALVCDISSNNGQNLIKTVEILTDDIEQFEVKNDFGGTLFFRTSGKGVGSLSIKMIYNVWPEDQRCKFDTTVDLSEIKSGWSGISLQTSTEHKSVNYRGYTKRIERDGVSSYLESNKDLILRVEICARFVSNENSGTTIIEVGLFDGFFPVKEYLDKLLNDLKSPVDRYEIRHRKIIFYLDRITYDGPTCINFRKRRNYSIRKVQSSIIRIYQRHKKNDFCTKFYFPDA